MIRNTEAYVVLRKHSQQMLDFAVLVCTAAPQLKHALNTHSVDPTAFVATNSNFPPSNVPYSTEKRSLNGYTTVLGANLLLSVFSYFETFFFATFDEIKDFHGGEKIIERTIAKQFSQPVQKEISAAISALRVPYKSERADRYRKFSTELKGKSILWPSQRFMLYGLKQAVTQRKRWKAVDIPNLANDLFGADLTADEQARIHAIRDERNKIAHGKNLSYDLRKAVDASYFLRSMALKIDAQVVKNFLMIERYAH